MSSLKNILPRFWVYSKAFLHAQFWQNKLNWGLLGASVLVNIMIWVLVSLLIKPSEFPIPLHYNIYFGIDLTGSYRDIFNLPAVGLSVVLIDFILAFWFYHKNRLISYLLLFTAAVVQFFVLIGAIAIIFINQ